VKLATLKNGERDGALVVVSRDLARAISAQPIAATLMSALERWDLVAPQLADLYARLNGGSATGAFAFDQSRAAAPLPRANQWLDGSTYSSHGNLMKQSLKLERQPSAPFPLMYQGMASELLGCCDDEPVVSEADQIDFEAEIGVIAGSLRAGASVDEAAVAIKLIVLLNDWSLRALVPAEINSGFGFLRSKAPTSFAPVAVTPDEPGLGWRDGKLHLPVLVHYNDKPWGHPSAAGMDYSFPQLVAHAASSRRLLAGTIIGSGTVSEGDPPRVGSSCIAETRGYEIIHQGSASSQYMRFGDRVRIEVTGPDGASVFGTINQRVVRAG
jgi:fumarylacetoacetate (FAA) hydrolase